MNQKKYFKCKWCGEVFKRSYRHRFYCSKKCASIAKVKKQSIRNKKWYAAHADYRREYMRVYMQKYRKKRGTIERFHLKAGTIYFKKTKDWNEELKLLEKFLYPLREKKIDYL